MSLSPISVTKSLTNNRHTKPNTHERDTTARGQHIKRPVTNTRPTNYPAPAPQSHSQGSTALHVKAKNKLPPHRTRKATIKAAPRSGRELTGSLVFDEEQLQTLLESVFIHIELYLHSKRNDDVWLEMERKGGGQIMMTCMREEARKLDLLPLP